MNDNNYYRRMKAKAEQAGDLSQKRYLNDFEGASYLGLSRSAFRIFAEKIGCRRKIGNRTINDRQIIDDALKAGDAD